MGTLAAQNTVATPTPHPWGLVLLLCAALCLNFFHRGNFAVAAPVLGPEFGMSQWAMGLLLSSFFWTYSVSLIGAGWLADRVEVRWVYAIGFLVWCSATLLTSLATSFAALLFTRLLLGVGESVAYPSNSRMLATVFPENRRGLANAVTDLGGRIGPFLGTMGGALLVAKAGWRGLFFITGGLGLLWLIPWLIWAPRNILTVAPVNSAPAGWGELLRRRDVWGTFGGLFGANCFWYFLMSWLPSYLVRERHFSMTGLSIWGALPYLLMAISSIAASLVADRWISRGASPVRVRRGFLVTGLTLAAVLLPLALIPRIEWALAGLFITCLVLGLYFSNLWALTQTLAGIHAAGRWTGMQNACGNIAGVLSPLAAGWIIHRTGRFTWAFAAASVACLAGAASFGLLVRAPGENREAASL